jgi:hypothetical protein
MNALFWIQKERILGRNDEHKGRIAGHSGHHEEKVELFSGMEIFVLPEIIYSRLFFWVNIFICQFSTLIILICTIKIGIYYTKWERVPQ